MNFLKIFCFMSFLIAPSLTQSVVPTYRIRPQGINRARELVGLTNVLYKYSDKEKWSGNLYAAPFFSQSMKPLQIGKALFGCDAIPCDDRFIIKIQGVDYQGEQRDARAWLADNFFLNNSFSSEISFKPAIKNTGLDIGFYLDLDKYIPKSYFRIHAPLVHTNWNLHFKEHVINPGGYNAPIGLYSPIDIRTIGSFFFQSFSEYAAGDHINASTPPMLNYSYITHCHSTDTQLADLTLEGGYEVWNNEKGSINVYAQLIIPTGTKRDSAKFLFTPQIGNDHHWAVGFGANAQYNLWQNEAQNKTLTFNADIGLSHLFENTQKRTFDLKDKPMSRYMMVSHFIQNPNTIIIPGSYIPGAPSSPIPFSAVFPTIEGNGAQANAMYFFAPLSFLPVANISTANVRVSIGIQADIVAFLNYTHNNWSCDMGYNFWAQSCERINTCVDKCTSACKQFTTPTLFDTPNPLFAYALKGDARIWGFETINPTLLSATESKADIHNGTNKIPIGITPELAYNQNVDNSLPATINNGADPITIFPNSAIQVNTSIQPVLLSCDDVDVSGSRSISNKLFAHASRNWPQKNCTPFLGLGGEVEWAQVSMSKCEGCKNIGLSQWSVWFKGGVSFN